MNKFKYLQIIGTVTLFLPAILVVGAIVTYTLSTSEVVEEVEEVTVKQDTVKPLILALPAPAPAPVVKKPAPVPPPAPAPEPPKVVKDTVVKPAPELDTAK